MLAVNNLPPVREIQPGSNIYQIPDALSLATCRKIIERFEAFPYDHQKGSTLMGETEGKQSTDLLIRDQPQFKSMDTILFHSLSKAIKLMGREHWYFRETSFEDQGYQIQRTEKGQRYDWHYDNKGAVPNRNVVVIWYLNTIGEFDGGKTEFMHQGLKIRPQAGKMIMFPADWTHYHRGQELIRGTKYIATTWLVAKYGGTL